MTQEEMNQKEIEKDEQKQEDERNAANNARAIRVAANVAEKSGNPYAVAAGKIVKAADTITGGRSTKLLGKTVNQANKITPGGKMAQKSINKAMESGAGEVAGAIASKKLDAKEAARKKAEEEAIKKKLVGEAAKKKAEEAAKKQAAKNNKNDESSGDKSGILTFIIVGAVLGLIMLTVGIGIPLLVVMPFANNLPNAQEANLLNRVTLKNTYQHRYDGEVTLEEYIAGSLAAAEYPIENLDFYKFLALNKRTMYYSSSESNKKTIYLGFNKSKYVPVGGTKHEDTIQRAVDETRGHFIYTTATLTENTIHAVVSKSDKKNYYILYTSPFMGEMKEQAISKDWEYISTYEKTLTNALASTSDIANILSIYLITEKGYTYQTLINEYYKNAEVANFSLGVTGIEVNGYISPLASYSCSSGFGCRNHPIDNKYIFHYGIDLTAQEGENVYATKAGTISKIVSNIPGYSSTESAGNHIVINHDDGSQTKYYHLLHGSITKTLKVGSKVKQGDKIAEVGSTGKSSGPHLHYEIIINGSNVNPYHYMDLTWEKNNKLYCNNNAITPVTLCEK